MPDIVSPETRSRMMAGIRGKNTKPEVLVRKALFKRGFRYKLHDKALPGKPDLVFSKYHSVIFVHGCFWHGHNCHRFKWPTTRPVFWKKKINRNKKADQWNYKKLKKQEWYILTIWECAIMGRTRLPFEVVIDIISSWLEYGRLDKVVKGRDK